MTAIAAAADVSRNVIYRHFANREALREAIFQARLDAVEVVLGNARLDSAPIAVALHRFVEGIVAVARRYPVDLDQMRDDNRFQARILEQRERLAALVRRATDEGVIRPDLPDGLVEALLFEIIAVLARQYPDRSPAQSADIALDMVFKGIGRDDASSDGER